MARRSALDEFRQKLETATDADLIEFFDQTIHACSVEAETPDDMPHLPSCVGASIALKELRRRNIVVDDDPDDEEDDYDPDDEEDDY